MAISKQTQDYINVGAALLGAYFIIRQLTNNVLNKISYGSPKFSLHNISLTRLTGTLVLPVISKNPVPLPLDGFSGYLFQGNTQIAQLQINQPITIRAKDTTVVSISVDAQIVNVASSIIDVIANGYSGFKLKGVFRSAKVNIPVDTYVPIL
ncbi:MAG: LEA type 2 family protein [Bacteroidota bacterium]